MAKKQNGKKTVPIVIGAIIIVCCMIPISSSLFGQTGYITEITRSERVGGRLDEPGRPNTYWWSVDYTFKMQNGKYETGSVQVKGDAVSSKSGLSTGSSVRYIVFAPSINSPGKGGMDGSTVMYVFCVGFGAWMIYLGVRKEKPAKTPAQRSREYQAAKVGMENLTPIVKTKPANRNKSATPVSVSVGRKMFCKNCGIELNNAAKFCNNCGETQQSSQQTSVSEPDWDSFEYDDRTALTQAEADELAATATEEEYLDEFDLINATDEGPEYYRKVLAIVRWRRANER